MPPHERTWRHPSELAAEERAILSAESASPSAKAFALTTGTLGLVAVAVLVLAMTPGTSSQPLAVGASTTVLEAAPAESAFRGPVTARASLGLSGRWRSGVVRDVVQATPIGNGRLAVVTSAALDGRDDPTFEVLLTSGSTSRARVVATIDDEVVVVALADATDGHAVASRRPSEGEIVTVMSHPPVTVPFDDLPGLVVDEGTAVLDDDGALVGLCSRSGDGADTGERDRRDVRLIDITRFTSGADR